MKKGLLFLEYEIIDSTVISISDMLILFCCVVDNHSFGVLESSPTCQVKLHVCTFDITSQTVNYLNYAPLVS